MMAQRLVRSYQTNFLQKSCLFETANRNLWFSTGSSSPSPPEVTVTKSKRSRRRFRRIEEVPSYKDFLHRQTVLALYRKFLRTVHPLSDQKELQAQIRTEFNAMKNESDDWNKKRAVKEGQRRLKDLQTTVSTSVTFGTSPFTTEPDGDDGNGGGSNVGTGCPWERNWIYSSISFVKFWIALLGVYFPILKGIIYTKIEIAPARLQVKSMKWA